MAKKRISIENLECGMFVTGLDVSWLKTPFLRHSILITGDSQIKALENCGAKIITIDIEKGIQSNDSQQTKENALPVAKKKLKQTSLNDELKAAKKIKDSTKKAMQSLFDLIQEDKAIKTEMLLPSIDQTIDSLSRNSHAIINLFHSRDKAGKLYNHAFNVMSMSLLIAQQLGYSEDQQQQIGLAALLMDIGWLKIPQELFVFQALILVPANTLLWGRICGWKH